MTGPSGTSVGRLPLFLGFLKIGLMGFGGVAPIARHIIVEERGWLSDRDYTELLGIGQILPGPNTVNAAVMIGDRFQGMTGAVLALAGLMAAPLAILLALALIYQQIAGLAVVRAILGGTAAAGAGLVIGTAVKMARPLAPTPLTLTLGALAFIGVGLLGLPLITVVACLAPLGIAWALLRHRRRDGRS